jgi:hypothetical protein
MMQPFTQQFVGQQHPQPRVRQRCGYPTCCTTVTPKALPLLICWLPSICTRVGTRFTGIHETKSARFMQASQQGLTSAAARYGAARGMLSVLGPAMWALFAGELAVKSIGTDYGRVVRAMYTLAQVRRQLASCAVWCFLLPSRAARMRAPHVANPA